MGRDFFKIVLPVEKVFPENVHFLYYPNSEQFTRVVDYKQFYRNESPSTLLGIEIPSHNNQLYPYPIKAEQKIAKRYLDSLPDRVHSIGRAGAYEYRIDISASIRQSIDLVASLA
jgi:UDP-galactopyranose mutase